ncbi:MAG: tRNA pseudouridine(38-40) synthase TruA [Flavobacteriales bacterium]|nr:tRNA pseudouridine(38-40) synthase TruA [Flavobacteriales bacterium]MCB9364123.1 tRNA pseudouridine(38-40) synthase TruA [Flavobacteriales bacterium]
MSRFFIQLKYKGTNYHGWQVQPNANSVQAEINHALATLLQEEIMVTGAGRTDTGVHATNFYAHFETEKTFDLEHICYKLNCILPKDISCVQLFKVNDDDHARFSATERTYEYWISVTKNPFLIDGAYFFNQALDIDKMNEAANLLIRKADFSCFSKSNTDTFTNDCTINKAIWEEKNDILVFTISADRFLRNMVRAIVGTLIDVGLGKIEPQEIKNIIASKNRSDAGTSVPAHGLYLTNIKYPNNG